ncbi:MAG: tetratricopeptide repeat protein [Gammaproteobacteria bacterium]|nr:tetratricopeptide repeat protein [Gammaproteobacteria bacterium]
MKLSISKILMLAMTVLFMTSAVSKEDSQYLLTEKTYKVLSNAQELMEVEKWSTAESKLKELLQKVEAASYEKAVVQQTLGYLYSSQEKYSQASKLFQQALSSNALPEKVSHNLKYNLGQLLLAEGRYKEGITLLEQWLKADASPPNSAYVLLASAYYRVPNYKKAIEYIKIAIKNDTSPKESWFQVLLSAHLELKQYKSAIKVLESLIPRYPYQKTYWSQLSALYLQQNKEFTGLAVKMLAQRLELGDAKILINMADMYRYLHIPYKSAQLLTNGLNSGIIGTDFDNLNRLAESWLAAREGEKAAEVLAKVAKLDQSGESDLKYGRVLFGLEQWKQAEGALTESLKKLEGKKIGSAALLLGMTQFHLGNLAEAKVQFSRAVSFENERNQAGQWLRHVNAQLEKTITNES